jgi:hypothetical protein
MHRAAMAVDAIAQPRSGENLKALGPARNNHPSPPPSVRFLSEGIGKEATNLMQDGFSSSGWVRCASRWSGASAVSRLLPHRLRWSKLQPPREWRNGRRAGLRIRCPKGRGSSTLPSRTTSDLRIFVLKFRAGRRGRPPCSTRRPAKSVCQRATPTPSRSQMRVDNNSSLLRIRAVACTRR